MIRSQCERYGSNVCELRMLLEALLPRVIRTHEKGTLTPWESTLVRIFDPLQAGDRLEYCVSYQVPRQTRIIE